MIGAPLLKTLFVHNFHDAQKACHYFGAVPLAMWFVVICPGLGFLHSASQGGGVHNQSTYMQVEYLLS